MEMLLCDERLLVAEADQRLLQDPRVLDNLLQLESATIPPKDYLKESMHPEIQPYMRKVVTTWLLEVCEEQECEEQVFPLAVNFLDRFLCSCPVRRCHLQLAAAVCLLVASKLRQCCSITLELLSFYTDYSVPVKLLREWEMMVLSRLRWDIEAVTAYDFLDHLAHRLPLTTKARDRVRSHAHTFVALCCTEADLIQTPPSLVASASLGAAARGLCRPGETSATLATLMAATGVDPKQLQDLMERIDDAVLLASSTQPTSVAPTCQSGAKAPTLSKSTSVAVGGGETPTDVQDVCF